MNRTAMMPTDPTIHCQWLVVGSLHQVSTFLSGIRVALLHVDAFTRAAYRAGI